jgi:phage terminase large subunit
MDFGYTNDPTALIDIYEYQGGNILDETIYSTGLSNKAIFDLVQNLPDPKTLIIADSADPKSIDELKLYGLNVMGAKKGQGSVYQGIQFVQGLKISITKRSVRTIKAYRNYCFFVDRDGKVTNDPDDSVHEWSNSMDAVRYGFNGVITGQNNAEIERMILRNIQSQQSKIYAR